MINQLLPTMSYGDAVSNSAVNMMKVLHSMGIRSRIYAQNIHPKMTAYVTSFKKLPKNSPIIYHLSTGSELANEVQKCQKQKILVYHNVTPPEFFLGYSGISQVLCREGREQLKSLANHIDFAIADSEYNKTELDQLGYKQTAVSPIIMDYEDYAKAPNKELLQKLREDLHITNFLFVGRIAPNKKQEDIIKTFYYYKRYINPNSRLFLVGSFTGMERYYHYLLQLIKELELDDVFITGHIPFDHILAYYAVADLFICLSEHEGFCVPLLEAMNFQVPIIAYKSSAVGETLGNGGILVLDKDYQATAELMHIVLNDSKLRHTMIKNQKERLEYFSKSNTENIFKSNMQKIIASL
jgi:glycosyltransferase involved in cell wall biosynthesis